MNFFLNVCLLVLENKKKLEKRSDMRCLLLLRILFFPMWINVQKFYWNGVCIVNFSSLNGFLVIFKNRTVYVNNSLKNFCAINITIFFSPFELKRKKKKTFKFSINLHRC